MNSNEPGLSYLLQKIYYKFIKNAIEKDCSLDDLVKELKTVGLVKPNISVKKVEDYIKLNLRKKGSYRKGMENRISEEYVCTEL